MRITIHAGSLSGCLSLVGTGLAMALPSQNWIGWLLMLCGVLVLVLDIHIERGSFAVGGLQSSGKRQRMIPQVGMLVCLVGFAGFAGAYLWPYPNATSATQDEDARLAIAQLAGLGWTVQPGQTEDRFEIRGMLPNMEKSALYLGKLMKPCNISIVSPPNLNGLSQLSDVKACLRLFIASGEFTDLSELRGLVNLTELNLTQIPMTGTGIVDGSALSRLTALKTLNLGWTRIKDLSFVSGMHDLKALFLDSSLVADISPLSTLPSLSELRLSGAPVSNLSPLQSSKSLKSLEIDGSQLQSISSLHNLHLTKLSVMSPTDIIDLSLLASMSDLEEIYILGGSSFMDASALGGMSKLRVLTLAGDERMKPSVVANIGVISKLHLLEVLALNNLAVSDISFVSDLHDLNDVGIYNIPIDSLEGLRGLTKIRKLYLANLPAVDISPLLSLSALSELILGHMQVRSDVLLEIKKRGVAVTEF